VFACTKQIKENVMEKEKKHEEDMKEKKTEREYE
jgi:hypothetical protein